MSEELKPCPFCGGKPQSRWYEVPESSEGYWGIDCCHAFSHDADERCAAEAWNTRALPRTPQQEEVERLQEALTPSLGTKAAYMGEFQFGFPDWDEDGNEVTRNINIPWTAIKEIMAAIRARAALKEDKQ